MKRVLIVDLLHPDEIRPPVVLNLLGHTIQVERKGSGGDPETARQLIVDADGAVDAIGLDGLPTSIRLGSVTRPHRDGALLLGAARQSPLVDGSGVRDGLERWAMMLADRAQPGIFAKKRVLMVPGFNHHGLAQALTRHGGALRYADPVTHFRLYDLPGVGRPMTLERAAGPTVERLSTFPFRRLAPRAGTPRRPRTSGPFEWADVLAGDVATIRRYAPARLERKTIVVEAATEEDAVDLARRGAAILVTLMPGLDAAGALGQHRAAVVEAVLVAARATPDRPLTEDTYLDLIADLQWAPAIRYLRPEDAGVNRFAFVIHPLSVDFIHRDPKFRWTAVLPDEVVEPVAALMPPILQSKVTGIVSPATGQRVEGYLISLGATPRQMMSRGERFTYERLNQAARMAERLGARIMGLGAFTSVVGDAGITVAHEADIAVTSGNSLTVAATLEAAKQAVVSMGTADLTHGRAMVVGATGSIGSVCARLLAQAIGDVVLVSIEPEKLIELKRRIQAETPGTRVQIATRPDDTLGTCDLVVTATSAFGQRVVDITRCKPGAVICDVARPPDIGQGEAALRPDVLVIESGEVLLPGAVDFGYDIGLPPGTAYACLAETALLAMEGRFEDYTLGRNIEVERVKEIYRLFKKHGLQIAGLRSHGKYLTEDALVERRRLADALRANPAAFQALQEEAAAALAKLPPSSKGVSDHGLSPKALAWAGGIAALAGLGLAARYARSRRHADS
ncbi:MAG: serine carboxypeptidase [Vicinamibacteraceae bacterium]|nr:serine carboxypeptidase [Vicinamibacteraceae bacterium]